MKTIARSSRKLPLRGRIRPLRPIALTAVLLAAAACGPSRSSVTTRTVTVDQQAVAAPRMVDISIVNLHDEPAADPAQETLVGTIVNHGDRAVSQLSVRVDALDDRGNVVHSITTPPLAQTIDPLGGQARFEASVPRNSAVASYHAVAIAR